MLSIYSYIRDIKPYKSIFEIKNIVRSSLILLLLKKNKLVVKKVLKFYSIDFKKAINIC